MLDLLVAGTGGKLDLLAGNGSGQFAPIDQARIGLGASDLAVADMDGDGRPDTVVANAASRSISVVLGDATGFGEVLNSPVGATPLRVLVDDVDRDGTPDVIVVESTQIEVRKGKGDGTFQRPVGVMTGSPPSDVAEFDVNGDGVPDLLVALPDQNVVRTFLGDVHGNFTAGPPSLDVHGDQPRAIVLGDVNGDERADLIVAHGANHALTLFAGMPGGFGAGVDVAMEVPASRLLRADFNGDGRADLVAVDDASGAIRVLPGTGGGFGPPVVLLTGAPIAGISLGDINGDRLPDQVASVPTGSGVVTLHNTTATVVRPGDLNRDGHIDSGDLSLLLNELFDGDGTDATSCAGGTLTSGAEADANGDGQVTAADVAGVLQRMGSASTTAR